MVGVKNGPEVDDIAFSYGIGFVKQSPCSDHDEPGLLQSGMTSKQIPIPW
jgi:hypothetical protein